MPQPEQEETKSIFKNLSKLQKIAMVVLIIFSLAIVSFWVYTLRNKIYKPFYVPASKENNSVNNINDINKDTDHDGLSDYDEENKYKTSIYLADTDSDGLSDKEEVDQGTNPLCPQGSDCSGASNDNINQSDVKTINNNPIPTSTDTGKKNENDLQKAMSANMDVETLRLMLIQGGADPKIVDKVSDDDLMKIYKQSLEDQNSNQTTEQNK